MGEEEDRGCVAVVAYCYSPARVDGTIMNLKKPARPRKASTKSDDRLPNLSDLPSEFGS